MKKILIFLSAIGLSIGLHAKPEKDGKKPGSKEGRPSREEIIKKFDKDGDGKLNDEEKAELRKKIARSPGAGFCGEPHRYALPTNLIRLVTGRGGRGR